MIRHPIPSGAQLVALVLTALLAVAGLAVGSNEPATAETTPVLVQRATFETSLDGFTRVATATIRQSARGAGRGDGRALLLEVPRTGAAATDGRDIAAVAGATYDVEAWVRASSSVGAYLRLQRVANGTVADVSVARATVGPTWTRLTARVVVGAGAGRVELRIGTGRLGERQRIHIDDVRTWRTDAPDPTPTPEPTPPTEEPPAVGSPLTNGCTHDERGIPSCGVYVGAAHGSNTDPSTLETDLGRRLSVRRTYYTGTGVASAVRTATTDLAAGRIPWISFKLPYSWEQMAAGSGDAWARDLAARMAALDGPVWLAFHHEPEGDGDIQAWRQMQERLAPIVRGAGTNLAFTVIVTGWNQFYGDARYRLSEIWPRGVDVDVAGFDIYQNYGVVKDGVQSLKWTDFAASYFSRIQAWADQVGVEWGLAETGITDLAAAARPDEIPDTVRLVQQYGGIAYTYFDTTLNSIAPWNLGTVAKKEQYGRALVASPARAR